MAIPARSPILPKASLYLGVTGAALIPFAFIIDTIANFVMLVSRSTGFVFVLVGGVSVMTAPGFAIAAIITGHIARRRCPTQSFGRAGLMIGYVSLGLMLVFGALAILTWWSISTKSVSH